MRKYENIEYDLRQDADNHWYWIPRDLLSQFGKDLELIDGKDYMEAEDEFDDFIEKYDQFRTLGAPENIPSYYLK